MDERQNLIADYDRLISSFEEAYARRGATFGFWFDGEQGRLTLAALKTARRSAEGPPTPRTPARDELAKWLWEAEVDGGHRPGAFPSDAMNQRAAFLLTKFSPSPAAAQQDVK